MNRRIFMGTVAASATALTSIGISSPIKTIQKVGDGVCVNKREDIWEFKILKAGFPDGNNNVYSIDLIKRLENKFGYYPIRYACNIGPLKFDQYFSKDNNFVICDTDESSHNILYLKIKGQYLIAGIQPQWYKWTHNGPEYTPNGIRLRDMLHNNTTPITMRTAGIGSLKASVNGINYIADDFQLLGVNAIHVDDAVRL